MKNCHRIRILMMALMLILVSAALAFASDTGEQVTTGNACGEGVAKEASENGIAAADISAGGDDSDVSGQSEDINVLDEVTTDDPEDEPDTDADITVENTASDAEETKDKTAEDAASDAGAGVAEASAEETGEAAADAGAGAAEASAEETGEAAADENIGADDVTDNSLDEAADESPVLSKEVTSKSAGETSAEEPEEVDPVHVHKYGAWVVTVKPTYFKAGKEVCKCSCGATKSRKVAKLTAKKKWVKNDGKRYYFNRNGVLLKGWHKVKTWKTHTKKWCFFDKNGVYCKNVKKNTKNKWVKAGGYTFYFYERKRPYGKGFHFINGVPYYMNKIGAVKHGKFRADDGRKYKASKSTGAVSILEYYRYKYGTYVLVDLSNQLLYFYKNYKHIMTANVVTGTKGRYDTPCGTFKVNSKATNVTLTGPTWSVPVDYWMAFIGSSYGLHDAGWRASYEFSSRKTYYSNGSHGCVNMRHSDAYTLYRKVSVGTPVIVQK